MAKKQYCVHCPVKERKLLAPQGLAAHTRSRHPGKEVRATSQKSFMPRKKKKAKKTEPTFTLEPINSDSASEYDAEFRLRIVLKIDVEK